MESNVSVSNKCRILYIYGGPLKLRIRKLISYWGEKYDLGYGGRRQQLEMPRSNTIRILVVFIHKSTILLLQLRYHRFRTSFATNTTTTSGTSVYGNCSFWFCFWHLSLASCSAAYRYGVVPLTPCLVDYLEHFQGSIHLLHRNLSTKNRIAASRAMRIEIGGRGH